MLTGKRARETLQELGPIAAGQRSLVRAGEGSALKKFCTGFLNEKFSTDTIYFQDFANGTDNINKSSTRGFRHRTARPLATAAAAAAGSGSGISSTSAVFRRSWAAPAGGAPPGG